MNVHRAILAIISAVLATAVPTPSDEGGRSLETLDTLLRRLAAESEAAYTASPFSALSRDYWSRVSRDPQAKATAQEVAIDKRWSIMLLASASPLAELMAADFAEFLKQRMGLALPVKRLPLKSLDDQTKRALILLDSAGGAPDTPESFTISVKPGKVVVHGRDPQGLRDGVVRLVDQLALRQAPFLVAQHQVYKPRIAVRLGAVPWMGSHRDLVFMGYNAVLVPGGSLYALSTSDAIPQLAARRSSGSLQATKRAVETASRYGLKTYCLLNTRKKFSKDDRVFQAHPDIRGALTWQANGEYVLCTEHPLVQRFLCESVEGIFRAAPKLDGIVIIIGGEGFYHCFMRSFGTPKGHTNCRRCEPLGAEKVVANLCNRLAEAARKVNPKAEVIAWPYSAEHVWSADRTQSDFIRLLGRGTGILTEVEKDEHIQKPEGVDKHLWDYSIDLVGLGNRAQKQIEACRVAGISVYLKSEPELGFEAPRLPHIPCMDRWLGRAEALAASGATGAFVFPAFRPCYGTSAAETYKLAWWRPVDDSEKALSLLASRIAGRKGGPHLRKAWKHVSEAIAFSPELPSYYKGPYYLGPAHPMCADPAATLPEVFYGRYLFSAEILDAEGIALRPTFVTSPTGNVPVFGRMYGRMKDSLKLAVKEVESAEPLVPERCRLAFEAESSPIRWFYHTARTQANFYESCQLRDRLLEIASKAGNETAEAQRLYNRWREVLLDEKENASQALPVIESDMRLDFYYGGDHTFPHAADMIRAKLDIIDRELSEFLPSVAARCGLD